LRLLQEENGRLAHLTLDKMMLQDIALKKVVKPSWRRPAASYLCGTCRVSQRRACSVARAAVSTFRYESLRDPTTAHAGDRASEGSLWLPQDPGAVETGRLESRQEAGVSVLPGRRSGAAAQAWASSAQRIGGRANQPTAANQVWSMSAIEAYYEQVERGYPPYHRRMMTKILVYGYCAGVFSSRRLRKRLQEDLAFRVLAAGNEPGFRTISSQDPSGGAARKIANACCTACP
jgi:transposase-like protein DUF772